MSRGKLRDTADHQNGDSQSPVTHPDARASTDCCIVGGGPAGAVLGLMLARHRVRVTLIERHSDFDRDFRGDTLHAAAMEIMDQLGLADRLLANGSLPPR